MDRRHRIAGAGVALAILIPTSAAAAADRPTLLPAVTRTVSAPAAADRVCTAATGGRAVAVRRYRAPMSGYLTTTLRGRGDWDLVLRDAASGRGLASSQGFGGREVAQAWVAAGQRVIAQACRRAGAARTASVRFRLADVTPPRLPAGAPSLVRVRGSAARLAALEDLGLDVTHNRRAGWADVVVSGTAQLARLRATGLDLRTRIADLTRAYAAARRADRAYTTRMSAAGGSPLPSGRTTYRTYEELQTELKALVDDHPGLVRPVVFGRSFQGREIAGIEIAHDVGADDGRPVYFLMGNHHAREWPSVEAAMEFAHLLVNGASADERISRLLDAERVVILPSVNPDGFVSSRGAFDPGDTLAGGDPNATLVEAVAPPGGLFAYRRKNCDGELLGPELPCELAWGVDNNRNYGNLWGGPGSSADVTSQSYHGPGPRSEPETQAVWNYARTHNVTMLMTLHNVAALVLRPPGLHDAGLAPDEPRMKEIGDAMGKAAGYTSQYSWQLYDTAGTTEDDTYAATGGYGYTIEMGPPDGNFHEPYETGVVAEWTGDNDHARGAGGLREALLIAAEAAASTADHAVVSGHAPPGRVLRLRRAFETKTSPYCAKGVEPVLNLAALPGGGALCLGPMEEPQTLEDMLDLTTTVPASGRYAWHVNQSTRPFVGGGAVSEETTDVDPPLATFSGAPGAPQGTADHEFTVPAGLDATDKVRVRLESTLPEDYDIEVFRREGDGLAAVGASGNIPGSPEEVLLADPQPGTYVVRVTYYAAATGAYKLTVRRVTTTRTVSTGTKEAYELTCELPDGTVLERRPLVIDRGQAVKVNFGCGGRGAGKGTAAVGVRGVAVEPDRVRATLTCPAGLRGACRGTLRVRGRLGRTARTSTLGAGRFRVAAGRRKAVTARLRPATRRAVRHHGRLRARLEVDGRAGSTTLTGARKVTLRGGS